MITARRLASPYRAATCRVVEHDETDWVTVMLYVGIACAFLALMAVVVVGYAIGVHTSSVDAAALAAAGR